MGEISFLRSVMMFICFLGDWTDRLKEMAQSSSLFKGTAETQVYQIL